MGHVTNATCRNSSRGLYGSNNGIVVAIVEGYVARVTSYAAHLGRAVYRCVIETSNKAAAIAAAPYETSNFPFALYRSKFRRTV